MKYIQVPLNISINEIIKTNINFAPSKFTYFIPNKNVLYKPLHLLIISSKMKTKIFNNIQYKYFEIGNINVNSGFIDGKYFYGINLPSQNPIEVYEEDILISTVRTYRKGIGIITSDEENMCCSPALFVISKTIDVPKDYILSILRSDLFTEQLLAIQNRGMYPRIDKNSLSEIYIPIPNESIINYLSLLQRSIINKEIEIRSRSNKINNIIENELIRNQKQNVFKYNLPIFENIKQNSRMDTGIYSQTFKKIDFLIKNYKYGYFNIQRKNIQSGSTPKIRFISKELDNLKYFWVTPTIINDKGFFDNVERLNMKGNNNINKNCMLIINRTSKGGIGEYVGISVFYDINLFGKGHHNQGIYRITNLTNDDLIFLTCLMNSNYYRQYCACHSVGSKMKEIKSNQFLQFPFPKFPAEIKKEIVNLYKNNTLWTSHKNINLNNYFEFDIEFNTHAGLLELSYSSNKIKNMINKIIDKIVNNENIDISFDFLK